jgi:uncharacterized protein YjbI with pentapeptide repeats
LETDLSKTDCSHSSFNNTRFFHTNLTKANFEKSTEYEIALDQNTVKGATFSLPDALVLLKGFELNIK